jgi:hypothetical protein
VTGSLGGAGMRKEECTLERDLAQFLELQPFHIFFATQTKNGKKAY